MGRPIRRVLVVGGGTAGWMAASYLARRHGGPGGLEVTLVESPDIGIIGVGEGSFSSVKLALSALGVDEPWFLRECSAAYKQGNRFVGWADGGEDFYYHPFSAPTKTRTGLDLAPYWVLGLAGEVPFAAALGSQHALCEARRGPRKPDGAQYFGPEEYAYHFDAVKLAGVLAKVGQDLGVKRLAGTVREVEVNDTGAIAAVRCPEHGRLEADLFVDCTGFAARLIGGALGVPFRGIERVLFQDSALAMQTPYDEPKGPLRCATVSTAQDAGWTWDISLENRRGVGYVFSSRYTDDETAERALRAYIGKAAEGLSARKLTFAAGWRERQWAGNCVAIGLSGGFMEPLESTGILLIGAAADMLSAILPRVADDLPAAAGLFNRALAERYERIVDFLKLHYCLTRRRDCAFWIDHADNASWTDYLRDMIPIWRRRIPGAHDLPTAQESFPLQSYRYVLYGMGFATKLDAAAFPHADLARRELARNAAIARAEVQSLPDHRALIDEVYASGYRRPATAA